VLGQTLGGRYGLAFGGICCIAVAVPVLLARPRVATQSSGAAVLPRRVERRR